MPGSSRRHKTADSSREAPPPQSGWTQEQRRLRRARMEAAAEVPLSAPSAVRGASAIRCSHDDNVYRDRLKGLYVVARSLLLLLLSCSAWPCLGPA